jgi:hypothetical protein
MRYVLLKECHDGPLAGHGGAKHTTTFFKKSYYWPNLKDDAEEYVKTCLTCQQNQTFNKKQTSLLQPLPILERPWESVSMDFMVKLPPLRGFDAIMVGWIDLAKWHISFLPRMRPWLKKRVGYSSRMFSSIMASQKT